jgi:type IV secretory pathway VirB2 component (pilin)
MPAPGELQIKGRRSWKSWQLVTAMVVAALVGMAINYRTVGSSASSNKSAYALPPPSGAASTTTTTTASSGAVTTTTVAVAAGTTTSSTVAAAASGPARLLLTPLQTHGNATTGPFTTTVAGWIIGWAFRCTPVPTSGSSFEVFVTTVGGTPSGVPAINQSGASGQSITTQSSLGQQTLVVDAPATCEWVVKVTGN